MKQQQAQISAFANRASSNRNAGLTSLCLLFLALLPGGLFAVTVSGLYTATVRVADRSDDARNAAVASALGVVLTKVSGRREAARLAGANSSRYVQRVGYVAGGQLEVGFDSAAINALLDQAALPLWDRERPNTLVVYPAALQGLREARATTELAARNRGLPLVWANGETSEQFASTGVSQIQALAQRYQAEAVLLARQAPGESSAANLRWQLVFRGATQELSGGVEDGPNLAAEQLSRYYAVSGKDSLKLVLEVAGVDGIEAYAGTLNYLSGLLLVRSVSVESLQADVIRLQLELRGNQESLRRILAVDHRLSELVSPTAEASATLSYRYNHLPE